MTTRHRTQSRGFATIVAVFMLVIVGMATAALTTTFTRDVKYTRYERQSAQLRQLLIAGAMLVQQQAGEPSATDAKAQPVAIPAPLAQAGATLTIQPQPSPDASQRLVLIEARYPDQSARQVLRFAASDGKWQLVETRWGT